MSNFFDQFCHQCKFEKVSPCEINMLHIFCTFFFKLKGISIQFLFYEAKLSKIAKFSSRERKLIDSICLLMHLADI